MGSHLQWPAEEAEEAEEEDLCRVCWRPYDARLVFDSNRQFKIPGASGICIETDENPNDYTVFIHGGEGDSDE